MGKSWSHKEEHHMHVHKGKMTKSIALPPITVQVCSETPLSPLPRGSHLEWLSNPINKSEMPKSLIIHKQTNKRYETTRSEGAGYIILSNCGNGCDTIAGVLLPDGGESELVRYSSIALPTYNHSQYPPTRSEIIIKIYIFKLQCQRSRALEASKQALHQSTPSST